MVFFNILLLWEIIIWLNRILGVLRLIWIIYRNTILFLIIKILIIFEIRWQILRSWIFLIYHLQFFLGYIIFNIVFIFLTLKMINLILKIFVDSIMYSFLWIWIVFFNKIKHIFLKIHVVSIEIICLIWYFQFTSNLFFLFSYFLVLSIIFL